ncbi:bifunctional tetrahydrofolate synthase/dihydrofolate synthase [Sinobacterium caligoides]|uniref:bifunctional tetrahydrofolate synthase/dihydrofolate synthase n=1 Tax=Sinobacterium caligoides TaxID=933926 RepID=UPI000F4D18F3|nr:bifunctional tetrahydrofolate synthase/dihydrofolate synthase [Sinobacterium caligoides]
MTVDDWLEQIERMHPAEIEMGLARISEVAERLSLLSPVAKVVTVAGTNGKGSTVATLEALLLAADVSVGVNTSPHLLKFNERIRVDGNQISDNELVRAFQQIDDARAEIDLTFFEFTTLAALQCFAWAGVNVVILEVGLGGRLDACNIIDADIAVVTNIAVDHESWLGSDRETIAPEKAGVCRAGKPVVCADPLPPKSLLASFDNIGATPYWIGNDFGFSGQQFHWRQPSGSTESISVGNVPLSNEALATALQVIALSDLPLPKDVPSVVEKIQLAGRFQRIQYQGRSLLLDVAHNPASALRLTERVGREFGGRVNVLFGSMADKDINGVIKALTPMVNGAWFVSGLKVDRAIPPEMLAEHFYALDIKSVSVNKSVAQALARAMSILSDDDLLVVCGSFFTVSETLSILIRKGGIDG